LRGTTADGKTVSPKNGSHDVRSIARMSPEIAKRAYTIL
jgi:hypothetical protein